jgi:CBS domain-containing protein
MKAQDVMSSEVVPVRPDMPAREIARLMRERHVNAVPVVEDGGRLVGMIGQDELDDEADSAADIMSPASDSIRLDADITEIAGVLKETGLEQVPVVRDGRVLGIVSRADVLSALASKRPARDEAAEPGLFARVFTSIDRHFQEQNRSEASPADEQPEAEPEESATAEGFQHLVKDFKRETVEQREALQKQAAEQRQQEADELADKELSDEDWQDKLRRARDAAEHGQTEFELLRFPNQLCSDGGRAVNVAEPNWPETLGGIAADAYRRFEDELKPQGFALDARVVDYAEDKPGDIGLFLTWGDTAE